VALETKVLVRVVLAALRLGGWAKYTVPSASRIAAAMGAAIAPKIRQPIKLGLNQNERFIISKIERMSGA
jgi:hypothetical protein